MTPAVVTRLNGAQECVACGKRNQTTSPDDADQWSTNHVCDPLDPSTADRAGTQRGGSVGGGGRAISGAQASGGPSATTWRVGSTVASAQSGAPRSTPRSEDRGPSTSAPSASATA